jgi:transcriptional regulator with XRE-family HTH domain
MSDLGSKEIMARNILYYMEQRGVTRQEVCDALGFKYTTFTDWVKGKTYPRIDKIEKMAAYFGVNKSDLVEERTDVDRKRQRMYLKLEKAPPDVLDKIDQMIDIMVQRDVESG